MDLKKQKFLENQSLTRDIFKTLTSTPGRDSGAPPQPLQAAEAPPLPKEAPNSWPSITRGSSSSRSFTEKTYKEVLTETNTGKAKNSLTARQNIQSSQQSEIAIGPAISPSNLERNSLQHVQSSANEEKLVKKTTIKEKSNLSFSAEDISDARAPEAVLDMQSSTKAATESCPPITERSSSSEATLYSLPNKNDKNINGADTERTEDLPNENSDLPAEDNQSLPNINKDTEKVTEGSSPCSQELATSSVPEVSESRAPLEQPTPPNINYNPGRGSQELTSSSAPSIPVEKYASDLPAEDNLPLPKINKDIGKETEATESGSKYSSQDLTTYSVPEVLPDWVPQMDNIYPSDKEQDAGLTFEGLYDSICRHGAISLLKPNGRRLQVFKDIVNEREFSLVPNTNDNTGREAESSSHGSQELTISSVPNKTVKHSTSPPDIKSQKELLQLQEKSKNTGKEQAESGSQVFQELTSLSAPNITNEKYASDLPAEDNPPLPNINKETESCSLCSQELASVPEVPESLAPLEKPTPPNINYNPGRRSQKMTSSSAPSIPVEKYASDLPATENVPLRKINNGSGKETEVTESGSQCSQDLTTSFVPEALPDRVPQMDNIHPSAADLTFGTVDISILQRDRSPPLLNPYRSSPVSQELTPNIQSMEEFPPLGPLPKKKRGNK